MCLNGKKLCSPVKIIKYHDVQCSNKDGSCLSWWLLLIGYFNCILCVLGVDLENLFHQSAFSRCYTNAFYMRTEFFYFCIFFLLLSACYWGNWHVSINHKGMGSTCSELRVSQDTFCGVLVLKNSNWPDFSLVLTLIWSVQRSVIKTWCHGLTWSNQDFAPFESELVFELFGRMSIKSGQTTPTRSWLPDSLIADYWVFIF